MRLLLALLLLLMSLVSQASATTWNPSDKLNVTLSNGNLTATITSASGTVRSTTSKSTGKFCFESTSTAGITLFDFGIANAAAVLGSNPNSANFVQIIPYDASAPQSLWLGGTELSSGTTISAQGEAITVCADMGARSMWFTDATMRAAGNPWNNSPTANPATNTGGASFAAMSCPCFIGFGSDGTGTSASTLNTVGSFAVATPSGFVAWDAQPSSSNMLPDLSNAAAHPVTGFSAGKIAYSGHVFPFNVSGASPDTPLATVTPIWNTYFGSLVKNGTAPVVNLSTGCSCDGSNGNLTDDAAFMGNWVAYANGLAAGGPAFTGTQQPMGNAWYSWGNYTANPDGTLNADGTLRGAVSGQAGGQAFYWSQLLQGTLVVQAATWNPNDAVNMTISGNNLTATSGSGIADVRATTGKTTGKFCWEATATTIGADWGLGLANGSYPEGVNGLGSDTNSFGFYPGGANPNAQIAYFNSTQVTSGTAQASVNGAKITECADFDANLIWVTDAAMQAQYGGNAWNNSASCNPTLAACGISLSGFTGPYFIAYTNRIAGVAVLNTTGPFAVALPSGFQPFDTVTASGGKPITIILGMAGRSTLH